MLACATASARGRQLGSTQTEVVEWPNRMKTAMMMMPMATPISTLRMRAFMIRFWRRGLGGAALPGGALGKLTAPIVPFTAIAVTAMTVVRASIRAADKAGWQG